MKAIILGLPLLALISCGGGQKTNATLEISKSFVSNSGFVGGLIITGKNLSNGKTFSQSLTAQSSLTLTLDKGLWNLSAVAWSDTVEFSGKPLCAKTQKDLVADNETVELRVKLETCKDPSFSAGHASSDSIKPLSLINTCKSFFRNHTPVPALIIESELVGPGSDSENYCDLPNTPSDWRSEVGSIRISAVNKKPTEENHTLGLSTPCMVTNSLYRSKLEPGSTAPVNPYHINPLHLPLGDTPFVITTYYDSSCSEPITVFNFKNGISAGDPSSFDHILLTRESSDLKLLLPSSDTRRAMSPFLAILPVFERFEMGTTYNYDFTPSAQAPTQYRATVNQLARVEVYESTCGALTSGTLTNLSCANLGDRLEVSFKGSTAGQSQFILNGNTYTVLIEDTGSSQGRFLTQKTALELFGYDEHASNYNFRQFFSLNSHNNDDGYGVLSEIRNMLSGGGAGGVIGITDRTQTFSQACANAVADKTLRIFNYERLREETYRVVIHNQVSSTPGGFICDNNDDDAVDCGPFPGFQKRMLVFDHRMSTILPQIVMEFNCAHSMGKFEMNRVEQESGKLLSHKEIVNWNTNKDNSFFNQRFEHLAWIKVHSPSNVLLHEKRSASRIVKRDANVEVWNMTFKTTLNPDSTYEQSVDNIRVKSLGTWLDFIHDNAVVPNTAQSVAASTNPYNIFTIGVYNPLLMKYPESAPSVGTFDAKAEYPSPVTSAAYSFNAINVDFPNNPGINGTLPMKLHNLNQAAFTGSFQGTFYSSP